MPFFSEDILLPVTEETVYNVLSDLEVLLRLSPFFSLKGFKQITAGALAVGSSFEIVVESYAERISDSNLVKVTEMVPRRKITWEFGHGFRREVSFQVEQTGEKGLRLTQRFLLESDDPDLVRAARLELSSWLRSIGEYLKVSEGKGLWRRSSKVFMDKVWLRLTLPERKIAVIIVAVSAVELFLLGLLVIGWNLYRGFGLVQRIFGGGS
jgi:hypothetical protein